MKLYEIQQTGHGRIAGFHTGLVRIVSANVPGATFRMRNRRARNHCCEFSHFGQQGSDLLFATITLKNELCFSEFRIRLQPSLITLRLSMFNQSMGLGVPPTATRLNSPTSHSERPQSCRQRLTSAKVPRLVRCVLFSELRLQVMVDYTDDQWTPIHRSADFILQTD